MPKSRRKVMDDHWDRVVELGCMVSGRPNPTLHHCHGGSMLEIVGFVNPGVAQKSSDWLVIPLGAYFHTGPFGIDNGQGRYKSVHQWELAFGRQVDFLDRVCRELGYNVWEHAGIEREVT